jgi:hypothetical protein
MARSKTRNNKAQQRTPSRSILRKKIVSFKKESDDEDDDLGNDESQKNLSFEDADSNDDCSDATEEETGDVNAVTAKSVAEMFEEILEEDEEIAQLVLEKGKEVVMEWYTEILEQQQQSQSQTQQQTYQEEDTDDDASLLASPPKASSSINKTEEAPSSRLDSFRQRRELERQILLNTIHEHEVIGEILVGRHIFRVAFSVDDERPTLRVLDNTTVALPVGIGLSRRIQNIASIHDRNTHLSSSISTTFR